MNGLVYLKMLSRLSWIRKNVMVAGCAPLFVPMLCLKFKIKGL